MDAMSHNVKSAAQHLIDSLPNDATWDDVMYRIYVRQCIDSGLQDSESDRVLDVDEVRRQFGLKQ